MKKYGIKLGLFFIAFALGTTAAILFWREGISQKPIISLFASTPDNQSLHNRINESLVAGSLSFDGEKSGCGNFIVYTATKDQTKVLVVKVDKEKLKLSRKPETFDLENNKSVEVFIYDFGQDIYNGFEKLCFDSVTEKHPIETAASSGSATISTADPWRSTYSVKVLLKNVAFRISEESIFVLEDLEINAHHVGLGMG
jgi:hypothetical protein